MPYYSDDIIEEVRSRNDIVDVISQDAAWVEMYLRF